MYLLREKVRLYPMILLLILTAVLAGCCPMQSDAPLEGKSIVCIGDSLFGMCRDKSSVTTHLSKITGAAVCNAGFGGCRISVHPTQGYDAFSMWAIADALAENDWTAQDLAAPMGPGYFPEHLAALKAMDFSEVDIVIIHYGTNDFAASVPLENPNDSTDLHTICGALRYSIETLRNAYPHIDIYISLPVYRFWITDDIVTFAEDYTNQNGNTLLDVCNSMRAIADEYGIPVIDNYSELGIHADNAADYLYDGTHLNKDGRKLFASYIASQLISDDLPEAQVYCLEMQTFTPVNISFSRFSGGFRHPRTFLENCKNNA